MKPNCYLHALSSYVPAEVLTNDDLSKLVETNDEWITTRTGIKRRHRLPQEENASDLGTHAARKALEDAGIPMISAEVTMIPQNYVTLTDETAVKNLQRTLELLEDDDDVQAVYHNWDE